MLSAIILAAGTSTRMGTVNKLLLPYKNKTVIAHTVQNIAESGIEEIVVITGHDADLIHRALGDSHVTIIYHPDYEKGITTSIQCGVQRASGEGYMICLSDMVLITSEEYALLKQNFENQVQLDPKCICLPSYNQAKGNPVIFSSCYREAILKHEYMEGCKEIVEENKENIFWVDMPSSHILRDMDYPEDYERIVLSQ